MNFTDVNPKILLVNDKYVYAKTKREIPRRTRELIKSLKIPRVYTTLWVSSRDSDILAIALDKNKKKQYYYSQEWISQQDSKKGERLKRFTRELPRLRRRIRRDLRLNDYSKKYVISNLLLILELTCMRIGNMKYLKSNNSFGLTTLKREHVKLVKPHEIRFTFKGKHGVNQKKIIKDKRCYEFIRKMLDKRTEFLFEYENKTTSRFHRISSDDINSYLHEILPGITCKDFRTYGANKWFAHYLRFHDNTKALRLTSEKLGNTVNTLKKSYLV